MSVSEKDEILYYILDKKMIEERKAVKKMVEEYNNSCSDEKEMIKGDNSDDEDNVSSMIKERR